MQYKSGRNKDRLLFSDLNLHNGRLLDDHCNMKSSRLESCIEYIRSKTKLHFRSIQVSIHMVLPLQLQDFLRVCLFIPSSTIACMKHVQVKTRLAPSRIFSIPVLLLFYGSSSLPCIESVREMDIVVWKQVSVLDIGLAGRLEGESVVGTTGGRDNRGQRGD